MKTNPVQPLARILASDPRMAAWHDRMRDEARLTAVVRAHLPRALAERVRVSEITPPVLQLAVAAGAIAAVLRQRTPEVLAGLRREGWNFTELRVRVQVRIERGAVRYTSEIQRDKVNTAPLSRLAARLPDGPLRTAVARLVRRCG